MKHLEEEKEIRDRMKKKVKEQEIMTKKERKERTEGK